LTTPQLSNKPRQFPTVYLFLASFLTLFGALSYAESETSNPRYQPPESLQLQVYDHLKQKADQQLSRVTIAINPISQRLKLPYCQSGVELFDKNPEKRVGRMTVQLSCKQPQWKLHVTASIDGYLPVVRSVRPILKQAIVQARDIEVIEVPYKKAKQKAIHQPDQVIGMRAKRNIVAGKIITIDLMLPPYLVFKNQPIKIISNAGGIRVETKGIALKSGTDREQIPIRNSNSKRVLKGIVIAPNTVWIP